MSMIWVIPISIAVVALYAWADPYIESWMDGWEERLSARYERISSGRALASRGLSGDGGHCTPLTPGNSGNEQNPNPPKGLQP